MFHQTSDECTSLGSQPSHDASPSESWLVWRRLLWRGGGGCAPLSVTDGEVEGDSWETHCAAGHHQ